MTVNRKYVSTGIIILVFLVAVVQVSRGILRWRIMGDKTLVTILEFSDFQCSACRKGSIHLKKLLVNYPKGVNLIFKHFPLEGSHPTARAASYAAECAGEQKSFWPYHDVLFERQREWVSSREPSDIFVRYARGLGLNAAKFQACLDNEKTEEAVGRDISEGKALGIRAIPTFFINQHRLVGYKQIKEKGAQLIESELKE